MCRFLAVRSVRMQREESKSEFTHSSKQQFWIGRFQATSYYAYHKSFAV
jgi:hypothetical protein